MFSAQTYAEAYLFIDLTPCECGETGFTPSAEPATLPGGDTGQRWHGVCPRCGRQRSFVFRFPAGADSREFSNRREPSELIDAGQWLWAAERYLSGVPGGIGEIRALPEEARRTAGMLLGAAESALDEAAKFFDGEDLPDSALWTAWSRRARDAGPDRFRRSWLRDRQSHVHLLMSALPASAGFDGPADAGHLEVVRRRAEVRAMWVARHGLAGLDDDRATPRQRHELVRAERAASGLDVATGFSLLSPPDALAAYNALVWAVEREFARAPADRDRRLAAAAAVRAGWLARTGQPGWDPDEDVYAIPADRLPPAEAGWEMVRSARAAAGMDPYTGDFAGPLP
ncbi:hypothetical protein [Actinoplanes siamensis]|uniref:Uncharacterized protein n=1 Tax=Actinoplanes siamensis TaxID=1223317 RepID=A0A919TJI8_9ACTN|nr:hypothetical protein [Actinoplanes siamensis]GIF04479.1 hypothetical protein Asi03nite_20170 [Actinoplanes siamensis]